VAPREANALIIGLSTRATLFVYLFGRTRINIGMWHRCVFKYRCDACVTEGREIWRVKETGVTREEKIKENLPKSSVINM